MSEKLIEYSPVDQSYDVGGLSIPDAVTDGHNPESASEPPVEFAPAEPYYWEPYPPDHPARHYLEELLAVPLDHYEKVALERYTENEFSSEINRSLIEGNPKYEVQQIDSAMDKVRLPRTTIVYRGQSSEKTAPEDVEIGTTFERLGYTSTSLDSTLARGWHNSLTVLKIEVPAGTPVAVPSLEEAEILLPHGSTFEIMGVTENEEYTEVQVRLVQAS